MKENPVLKVFGLSLMLIGLGAWVSCTPRNESPSASPSTVLPQPEPDIRYESQTLGRSTVHTLLIPSGSRFSVRAALSQELSSLTNFAQKHQAVAAINGGFFDPANQKSTVYVVEQGELVANPRNNERLMHNPANRPYLEKILNRTEFRRYRCGSTVRYDITLHSELIPQDCQLIDALGGGPRLLPELTLLQEGFFDAANGKVIRDPLSSRFSNARSAVGITREGNILLVMVGQMPKFSTTSGMSLTALTAFMKSKGVEEAMNLDGGSSSSFYYKGKTIYGKVDARGNQVRRPVLSVLLVQERAK